MIGADPEPQAVRQADDDGLDLAALGYSPALRDRLETLLALPSGMLLVTGPTGSGKSTTLASIIDYINDQRELHILTVEDPIEYVHEHKCSVVNQREIGVDCHSFERALRSALREDPDVLLVGEMRDLESIQIALTMAETGHLVFGTIHASTAATTINRILDLFPPTKHGAIRKALANNLKAVVAQKLLKGLIKPRTPTTRP